MKYIQSSQLVEAYRVGSQDPIPAWFMKAIKDEVIIDKPNHNQFLVRTKKGRFTADTTDYIIMDKFGNLTSMPHHQFIQLHSKPKTAIKKRR